MVVSTFLVRAGSAFWAGGYDAFVNFILLFVYMALGSMDLVGQHVAVILVFTSININVTSVNVVLSAMNIAIIMSV